MNNNRFNDDFNQKLYWMKNWGIVMNVYIDMLFNIIIFIKLNIYLIFIYQNDPNDLINILSRVRNGFSRADKLMTHL